MPACLAKRSRKGTFLSAFSLLCLLGLLAAGCGKRETLVDTGDRNQVLHRSIGHELADLDPQTATMASDYHVLSALFEGLVSEDPQDLHPIPGVAERWEQSMDASVYTFHLRSDARWSDGSALNSSDFVNSYKRILSPGLAAENATQFYLIKGAEDFHKGRSTEFRSVGIEAPDEHTLRIVLRHPAPWFLSMISQPAWYPVHLPSIRSHGPVDRRGGRWTKPGRLVGNGPFVLKEWSVNNRIVVVRSDTYWDRASVRLREINFYPLAPDTEERAFRAGQLHVTEALPPGKAGHYLKEQPHLIRVDPLLGTYFYRLNTKDPTLADPRVRRALSLSVGREKITRQILMGVQGPARSFTPEGIAGYTPPRLVKDDPETARRLLAEAGYPGGAGFPTLDLLYNSSETHRLIAEAVQESWRRELGIHVRLANMDNASVLDARRTGNYQILRSSWTADFADAQNFLDIWRSTSPNNFTGWSDIGFDSLLETAASCTVSERRERMLQNAETRLLDAAPCIPVYSYSHVYLLKPSVKGWHSNILDHHPYKHVWLEP